MRIPCVVAACKDNLAIVNVSFFCVGSGEWRWMTSYSFTQILQWGIEHAAHPELNSKSSGERHIRSFLSQLLLVMKPTEQKVRVVDQA